MVKSLIWVGEKVLGVFVFLLSCQSWKQRINAVFCWIKFVAFRKLPIL